MGPDVLNRLRLAAGLLLLGLAHTALTGSPWPFEASRFQVGILAVSGVIGFVFGDAYYFRALVILGPGRAAILASLAPAFTVLIAWPTLGERPGLLAILGMALIMGGVGWVAWERQPAAALRPEGSVGAGVLAGVLGALGQAGGYVLSRSALQTGIDPLSATVIRITAACLGIWVWAGIRGAGMPSIAALRDRRAALLMLGGAFSGPFLGVTLSLVAIRYIEAGVAASITAFYPIPTLLISARFRQETISWRSFVGAGIAITGVLVLFLR